MPWCALGAVYALNMARRALRTRPRRMPPASRAVKRSSDSPKRRRRVSALRSCPRNILFLLAAVCNLVPVYGKRPPPSQSLLVTQVKRLRGLSQARTR